MTASVEQSVVDSPAKWEYGDDLWHRAATRGDETSALAGGVWRTACGQRRTGVKASRPHSPNGLCLVCRESLRR